MTTVHTENYPLSYYYSTLNYHRRYARLEQKLTADICIVGGGFTGVATALELAERGYKVVLLEARKIGWGASGRNGGQLIRGIGQNLESFRKNIGQEGIDAITAMGFEANEIVIERVKKYQIDCDLTLGYCDLASKAKHLQSLSADYQALKASGYPYDIRLLDQHQVREQVVNSANYIGGLEDMGSGHLHPLNLCTGEAEAAANIGVQIYEESAVVNIEHGEHVKLTTAHGQVTAGKVVLAGNAYLSDLAPQISAKILPAGSYIIATEPLTDAQASGLLPNNHALCDMKIDLDYFRLSADKRLLFGGMCNYSGRDPKDIKAALYPKMLKVFPQLAGVNIDYQWGGMIGIGANRLPQLGRIKPNVFYAQAYSGHGVNVSHLAAKVLAEAITGESERIKYFEQVPHITFPGGKYLRSPLLAAGMMYHKLVAALTNQ